MFKVTRTFTMLGYGEDESWSFHFTPLPGGDIEVQMYSSDTKHKLDGNVIQGSIQDVLADVAKETGIDFRDNDTVLGEIDHLFPNQ